MKTPQAHTWPERVHAAVPSGNQGRQVRDQSPVAAAVAASPHMTAQRLAISAAFGPTAVVQRLNSAQKKLLDPIKAAVAALGTPEERWNRIKQELDTVNAGTEANIKDGARYLKVVATAPVVAPVVPVGPATPFVSLQADVDNGLYTVATGAAKIRASTGEDPFEAYSDGTSVDDAVEEAIAGLDLTGSISFKYSRHDFQPTSKGQNLQVQLGGARAYRVGKGDTSSTLVVVDDALWATLKALDAPRLKLILQAAHRQSFTNVEKVELLPVPD